jgi:hypothetical protein
MLKFYSVHRVLNHKSWLIFSLCYLLFVFPFCYFRHDDWLILGNAALIMPRDWHFLWKPTLFYGANETVWFFRPFFKLGVFVLYQLFGMNYYLWLTVLLLMTLGMIGFIWGTVNELTQRKEPSSFAVALFASFIPLHFGSLAWMGEGCMNIPQGALLAANTFFFFRYLRLGKYADGFLALTCFVLSLGFKESSAAHPLFLFLVWLTIPNFRKKAFALVPYAVITFGYLWVRLLLVPINPAYLPHFNLRSVSKPLVILTSALVLPWFVIGFLQPSRIRTHISAVVANWPLFLFFIPCFAPYLGHGFFSPGWLFLPGFYISVCFGLLLPINVKITSGKFAFWMAAVSILPVVLFLTRVGWWNWHTGEKEIVDIVRNADTTAVTSWAIQDCESNASNSADMGRVIGFSEGLSFLWEIEHGNRIPMHVIPCENRIPASEQKSSLLLLKWDFPHVSVVKLPQAQ